MASVGTLARRIGERNYGGARGRLLKGGWGLESSGRKGGLRPDLRGPKQKGKGKI